MNDIKPAMFVIIILSVVVLVTLGYVLSGYNISGNPTNPKFVDSFSAEGMKGPISLAYVPEQEILYVSDPGSGYIYGFSAKGELKKVLRPRKYGEKGFLMPGYIESYEGNLLVSDPMQNQIFVYNEKGECSCEFIESEMPLSFSPGPVAAFGNGRVAVSDLNNNTVIIFAPTGRKIKEIGKKAKEKLFVRNNGMDIEGEKIYLSDYVLQQVIIVGLRDINRINLEDEGESSIFPKGLKVTGGMIYLADPLFSKVFGFKLDGTLKMDFGQSTSSKKSLYLPVDIEIFSNKIFVLEKGNKRISVWER